MWKFLKSISWGGALFLGLSPVAGLAGVLFLAQYDAIRWPTIVFAVGMAVVAGIGVTAGYHRLFAHRSYDAKGPVRLLLLFFGAASFENSALRWASDHRNHHKFVDTDRDPYNIKKGFWHAHMGWICFQRPIRPAWDNVSDLRRDSLVMFQEKWFATISLLSGFAFPMAVAALWGDPLGGLILAGFIRIVLNHHFTFAINSVCHYFGNQPYSDRNSARDSLLPALFTYGEGYHNFHHTFPSDYRNGVRPYHWDPTKWFIRGLVWVGQAKHLRRIPRERILSVRLRMDQKRLLQIAARADSCPPSSVDLILLARQKIEAAYVRVQSVRNDYRQVKKSQMNTLNQNWLASKKILGREVRRAKCEFRQAMREWRYLRQSFGQLVS